MADGPERPGRPKGHPPCAGLVPSPAIPPCRQCPAGSRRAQAGGTAKSGQCDRRPRSTPGRPIASSPLANAEVPVRLSCHPGSPPAGCGRPPSGRPVGAVPHGRRPRRWWRCGGPRGTPWQTSGLRCSSPLRTQPTPTIRLPGTGGSSRCVLPPRPARSVRWPTSRTTRAPCLRARWRATSRGWTTSSGIPRCRPRPGRGR